MQNLTKADCEDKILLDLMPMAENIERMFSESLAPAPAGIYRQDVIEPVLIPGEKYFVRVTGESGTYSYAEVTDINSVTSTVYNAKEKVVIPALILRNKATMLSDHCFYPYRGLLIAAILVGGYVEDRQQWRRNKGNYLTKVRWHFKDTNEVQDEYDDIISELEEYRAEIGELLDTWLWGKEWHIFLTNRKHTQLSIERYGDFRIHDWMERHQNGEITL